MRTGQPHQEAAAAREHPVRAAYQYLAHRREQLDYAGARTRQLPIGSGEIESARHHVIQQHLKLAGGWRKPTSKPCSTSASLEPITAGTLTGQIIDRHFQSHPKQAANATTNQNGLAGEFRFRYQWLSVRKPAVQVSRFIALVLGFGLLFLAEAGALTFENTDGTKITGEIVRPTAKALQVRTEDNKYVELEWSKLSQTTLQELKTLAQEKRDNRLLESVEPYIEIPEDEIIKKTEVVIKPVPRLERPPESSLLGAMFKSSVGLVCLLLLYAANIYAGYEISTIRAYPAALVCGVSAIAPVIGPIIFLCLPTKMTSGPEEEEADAAAPADAAQSASYSVPGVEAPASSGDAAAGHGAAAPATAPQTQIFKRGQFTFNRRFIETKFSSFFGTVRRGDDKDMVLLIKSVRTEYVAVRITRVASNDMHLEIHKGGASQEVQIPFAEIQEIQLKHKDA